MTEYVTIHDDKRFELETASRARLPYECCGVLFGSGDGRAAIVDGFAVVRNRASEPTRAFEFEPADWIAAFYEAQKNQRRIVGFFHSHPQGPCIPSRRDAQGWPGDGICCIVCLSGLRAEIRFFRRETQGGWAELHPADRGNRL